jgi:hypothetical protein
LELEDIKVLAIVADLYQMTEVSSVLDETVLRHLDIRMCGDVLSWSGGLGLKRSEEAAHTLAAERFEKMAKTEGFLGLLERLDGLSNGQVIEVKDF